MIGISEVLMAMEMGLYLEEGIKFLLFTMKALAFKFVSRLKKDSREVSMMFSR